MYRALLTVEALASELGLGEGLREVGSSFFAESQRQEFIARKFDPENLDRVLVPLLNLKRDAPAQIEQVLGELANGNLSVKADVSESPRAAHARNQRTRLVTIALLAVSIALLLTIPNLPHIGRLSLSGPLALLLIFLYVLALALYRKL
jgi:hypothetical protein